MSVPPNKQRTYDWKGALRRNHKENERLRVKYEREPLTKYKISATELDSIKTERLAGNWPLPPLR